MKSYPADITINGYLKFFIEKCNNIKTELTISLSANLELLNTLKAEVTKVSKFINDFCNIDIIKSKEYNDYDIPNNSKLKMILTECTFKTTCEEDRNKLLLGIKFINAIELYKELIEKYKYYDNLTNISFREYRKIVKKYYSYGVSKCLVEGYGYKFTNKLGYLMFAIYNAPKRKYLDFGKTDEMKKKIIASGYELKKDFKDPNDKGIDYRVYFRTDVRRMLEIIKCLSYPPRMIAFSAGKLKGTVKIEKLAETCNNLEDVYNLDQPATIKAAIAEILFPGTKLKYIRTKNKNRVNINKLNTIKYSND